MKYTKKQIEKLISLIQDFEYHYVIYPESVTYYTNTSTDIFEYVSVHPFCGKADVYFFKLNFNENIYSIEIYIDVHYSNTEELTDKDYCKQHAKEGDIQSYNKLSELYAGYYLEDDPYLAQLMKYSQSLESAEVVEDFIYKVDDSSKLAIQSTCSSIEEFFAIDTDAHINIITVDTKETIAQIKRSNNSYKFIVDLINEDDDAFNIKTTIKTKANLNKLIEQTVEALRLYSQFSKYADDLEDTIK